MAKRSPFLIYIRIILLVIFILASVLLTFSEAKRRERMVDFAEVYPIVHKYSEEYGVEENMILAMIRTPHIPEISSPASAQTRARAGFMIRISMLCAECFTFVYGLTISIRPSLLLPPTMRERAMCGSGFQIPNMPRAAC